MISEFVVTPKARVSVIGSLHRGELLDAKSGGRGVRQVRLRLPATLTVNKALSLEITTFVDTGSEVSLIKRGLLPEEILQSTHRPVQLVTASGQPLRGGSREAWVDLGFMGHEVGKPGKVVLATPTRLLEADMEEDVLLSYEWLGDRDFDVHARRHGLMGHVSGKDIWVSGIKEDLKSHAKGSFTSVRAISVCPTKRALDLFCGRKSAALALEKCGFAVETFDIDPGRQPTICADILDWDYTMFPPGHFDLVTAAPPCTEYSLAMNRRPRRLDLADEIVRKTLEVIAYLQPERWWLETPRNGLLARRSYMVHFPQLDCDQCCFEDLGYQKPTRFFGSAHLLDLSPKLCNRDSCLSLRGVPPEVGKHNIRHLGRMGGNGGRVRKEQAYHIPETLIWYASGLLDPVGMGVRTVEERVGEEEEDEPPLSPETHRELEAMIQQVRIMRLRALPAVDFLDENPDEEEEVLEEVARRLLLAKKQVSAIRSAVEPRDQTENGLSRNLEEALIAEFGKTSLSGKYLSNPPVRGPFGEAEILLRPDAHPVSVPPFQLSGERRDALDALVGKAIEVGKLEAGKGPWNTPAFPVPKKVPHTYRLVQDLRPQNAATMKDGHPLPRIGDMVHRQGKNQLWTVLDLVDGFHQMPLKKEHRYITCMSTPRGTQQWTVQVMGLKNAGIQFQRMMEWVLEDLPATDPYLDDTITGTDGLSESERLWNNYHAVRALLKKFELEKLVCSPEKSHFFQKEVEFCGHVLREGRRSPAPGKLLPIQQWELPRTVTELRGFLGLTNYFSEYVEHYAATAAPLMGKLQLNRRDGRKGSKLRLTWNEVETKAFEELKEKLCKNLELWQPNLDMPYRLHCDASDLAIGAELTQQFGDEWRPVAFYSRKLAKSQQNWAPREKETYAIVAALRKWSGIIGFQPVLITTDHRAIEEWVTEHVDTPSGPRGRRARWHETLSQFDLEVKYIPGPENVIPDALSRWAYPASSAREDVSFHGSLEAREEVRQMALEELARSRVVGMVRLRSPNQGQILVGGGLWNDPPLAAHVHVVTRSSLDTDALEEEGEETGTAVEGTVGDGGGGLEGWRRSTRRRRDRPLWSSPTSPTCPLERGRDVDGEPGSKEVTPPVRPLASPSQAVARGVQPRHGGRSTTSPPELAGQLELQPGAQVCPPPPVSQSGGGSEVLPGDPPDRDLRMGSPRLFDTPSSSTTRPDLGFRFKVPRPSPSQPSSLIAETPEELPGDVESEEDGSVCWDEEDMGRQLAPGCAEPAFRFADPPPGARPGQASRLPPARVSRGPARRFHTDPSITPEQRSQTQLLDQDWAAAYDHCEKFSEAWEAVQSSDGPWPDGYKVFGGHLYHQEKLCVPELLVREVLKGHHEWVGHVGNDRLMVEVQRRYTFPPGVDLKTQLQEIRRMCLVCQACDRPNWAMRRPLVMTPIPDRFMVSVCLDVFTMPSVEWRGQVFDAFLMCVDRHSGWMVARPTQKLGLTGEKAAHLMLDSTWGEVGIPSIVTSDQGPQFVSQWWVTMCARLGIRMAYAQAHRPQANGRAEVAGRVVQDLLRKILVDNDLNWVEVLPRALRIHHDMVDPVTNLAPYEVVFGRERSLAGLPWTSPRDCIEAEGFFEKMSEIDSRVSQSLNEAHAKLAERLNANRASGVGYTVGDWVWYLRPKNVGGAKLQTWWQGPFRVLSRAGERSYRLRTPQGEEFDVHQDQLKPCVWEDPTIDPPWMTLRYPPGRMDEEAGNQDTSLSSSPQQKHRGPRPGLQPQPVAAACRPRSGAVEAT